MDENKITEINNRDVSDIQNDTPARKIGFINGFNTCSEDCLLFIRDDIDIDADISELKCLQSIFKSIGRNPTVAELFFVLKGLRNGKAIAENEVKLVTAALPDDDIKALLSDFTRRYSTNCGTGSDAPVITKLMQYAVTGRVNEPECGISIEPSSYRAMPPLYSGAAATVNAGELTLTLSRGKPIAGTKRHSVCVLISAESNEYSDEYLNRALAACRKISKSFRGVHIISTSRFGLVHDLEEYSEGMWVDASLLPTSTKFAEDVFDAPTPSFIIFADRYMLPTIWQITGEFNILPKAPISLRKGNITVNAEAGMVDLDRKILNSFKWNISGNLSFDRDAIGSVIERTCYDVFDGEYSVETFSLDGGNIYEALEEIFIDKDADYAVGGILDTFSGKALPTMISFDAFRKNSAPAISFSKFFIGNKTNIIIFKIKSKK